MKKSWNLLPKILSGEKKIESRWYKAKYSPWGKIKKNEIIYIKESGSPINVRATVHKVIEFSNLNPEKIKKILNDYGRDIGIEKERIKKFFERFEDKKYCILIFLKNSQKIKPFHINKNGFGLMSAWICTNDIKKIKK